MSECVAEERALAKVKTDTPAISVSGRPVVRRIVRDVLVALMISTLIVECVTLVVMAPKMPGMVGADYWPYARAASDWLAGGSFYYHYQLAGPYALANHEIMYPPTVLVLLVPFKFLPVQLYWAIPTAVTVWCIVALRPSRIGWLLILDCLAFPWSPALWIGGNPVIWVVAGIAAGTRFGWPAVAVALKPQFAPLAIVAVGRRSFWLAAVPVAALSVLMLPMWLDWLTAIRNISSWPDGSWAYWLNNVPLLAMPLLAWGTSMRQDGPFYLEGTYNPIGAVRAAVVRSLDRVSRRVRTIG